MGDKYWILPKYKDPTIFVDFPLIGSHEFQFPTYINANLFWPNEERNTITLFKTTHAKDNKEVLLSMVRFFDILMKYLAQNEFQNI